MTHGRWRFSALAALPVCLVFTTTAPEPAFAQNSGGTASSSLGAPRLPSEIFAANPVTQDQIRIIEAFADFSVAQLVGNGATPGVESQVVSARNDLIQPLSFPGVSADFRTQYSRVVAQRLKGATAPDRPLLNRLNTMIVVSRLQLDATVFDLLMQALSDESPAVRYWAVKALSGRQEAAITPQQLGQVLNRLQEMVANEDTLQVLQQVFLVLVDLPGTQGLQIVVDSLNQRVAAHNGQPLLPYDAEQAGMRAAFSKMLALQPAGVNVDAPLKELARAATQYLTLIAKQGQPVATQIEGTLADGYRQMAALCHQVIGHAQQHFGAGGSPLPPIGNALNWPQFDAAATAARNMLIAAPFNFTADQVTPPAP